MSQITIRGIDPAVKRKIRRMAKKSGKSLNHIILDMVYQATGLKKQDKKPDEIVELAQIGDLTSDRYSRIAAQLKRQGTPIPTNDIWIAAQTLEHGVELITSDQHFEKINGLVYTICSF